MEKIRKGTLIKWDDDKGFGFIQQESGDQIFLHISNLKKGTRRRPVVGDIIYFHTEKDERGRLRASQAVIKGVGYKYVDIESVKTLRGDNTGKRGAKKYKNFDIESHRTPAILMPFFWIIALCPFGGAFYFWENGGNFLPLLMYSLVSVTTFCLYDEDKLCAKRKVWRISEATLHFGELCGGWPGALIAQHTIRHKNKKFSYQLVFWCIVLLHGIGWSDYLFLNSWLVQKILEMGSEFYCILEIITAWIRKI